VIVGEGRPPAPCGAGRLSPTSYGKAVSMADKKTKKPQPKPVYIYVKKYPEDGEPAEVVHKVLIPRSNLYARHIEKVERGMLINMDTENYFVDTTEADAAVKARKAEA
jgi:hypothetical protein